MGFFLLLRLKNTKKKIIVLILYASETVRKLENSICFFVKLLNELKLAQMINTIAAVGK